jgi:beta-galactosidase
MMLWNFELRRRLKAGTRLGWLAALFALAAPGPDQAVAGVQFARAFAPQNGWVSRYEQPTRAEICLNGSWRFQGDLDRTTPAEVPPDLNAWNSTPIKIPSPWNINAFWAGQPGGDFRAYPSYPAAWESLPAAWMEKTVNVPGDWSGRRILLHFNAVAGKLAVFVNGQRAGEGFDLFFPQDFDVTGLIRPGGDNQILVKVVAPKAFDQPRQLTGNREYLSGSFWGTFIAGIWQDVFLLAVPQVSVDDVFVQPWVDRDELLVETTLGNHGPNPVTVDVSGVVRDWVNLTGHTVLDAPEVHWKLGDLPCLELPGQRVTLAPGETRRVTLQTKVAGRLKPWSPNAPNLQGLLLTLSVEHKTLDVKYQRFGWRQFRIEGNRFLLNGQPIVLRGDSWHFLGIPQMTRRYACAWYQLVKDAGANAVRLHASVYPSFYQDMADEMGMLILDESAIWASDGGPMADSDLFWTNCRTHVRALVRRDRNHPCVYGWSVCNEILPVLRNVWHTPPSLVDRCLGEIAAWRDICLTNDPTHSWISGDGEEDAGGRLPVCNLHYAGAAEMQRAAAAGKPWAVGETSMAYYGTPKQVSQFNGPRAYESALGRMEGLARECYGLLHDQQKFGGNYQSVFNIVWYAVQPLPLGKSDLSKPIDLPDGIFFRPYQEGVPGVQPERLGPYVSTLNPGYDPGLPLYRPWPMFDAIRDANTGNTNSPWAHALRLPLASPSPIASTRRPATAAYLSENASALVQKLSRAGLQASAYAEAAHPDFLLVDGSPNPDPGTEQTLQRAANQTLARGGTVWIWNVTPAGSAAVGRLVGQPVSAVPRQASSFAVRQENPLLSGLDNASLYFAEDDDWSQMSFALDGDFIRGAQVLLAATKADWRRWNYQPEPIKTASLYRSEVENPSALTALAIRPVQAGHVLLCNLSPDIRSPKKSAIIAKLLQNEGLPLDQANRQGAFLDAEGRLSSALVCGSFGVPDAHAAYTGKPPAGEIRENVSLDGQSWRLCAANASGIFDFNHRPLPGPRENAFAYLAVWIKSPKPLNDLLAEPNLPKLAFTYGADDGCEVWLNGELLASHERIGPLEPESFTLNPLLLKLGWNQLVVKVVQVGGEWQFTGKFACAETAFLAQLQFATEKPANDPQP